MRKPYIAANWKMNMTIEETEEFIGSFIPMVKDVKDVDILLGVPYTALSRPILAKYLQGCSCQPDVPL
jgi:triosephosphate isomerase